MQNKLAQNKQLAFWACVTVWAMFQESLLGRSFTGDCPVWNCLGNMCGEIFRQGEVNFSQEMSGENVRGGCSVSVQEYIL